MDYALWERAYYQYVDISKKWGHRPESALGKYINRMRMASFKNFGYDTKFEF